MKKRAIAILLCAMMILSLSISAGSLSVSAEQSKASQAIATMETNLPLIEQELVRQGTSVEEETLKIVDRYEQMKAETTDAAEIAKLQDLIDTQNRLAGAYSDYKNGIVTRSTRGIYDPAIAVVTTYFNTQKYYLAGELLAHAASNDKLDSAYRPTNAQRITTSLIWQNIRKSTAQSGSGEFKNEGTVVQKDLYYAIHYFEWYKKSGTRVFSDRYDFAPGDYSDITGIAVNTMYNAQEAGDLVPFYVIIIEVLQ